jgi:hypothetical protein
MLRCTVKKVSGIPAGDGKIANICLQCGGIVLCVTCSGGTEVLCALLYMVYSNSEFKSATPYNGTNKYDIKFTSPPVYVVYYYMLQLVNNTVCYCKHPL